MSDQAPAFAVVGHPNKGKSSVVAALTQNDAVVISPLSGTTQRSQRFSLKQAERTVFDLVDTPGFQRAGACLAWLQQEPVSADLRPQRVHQFLEEFEGGEQFQDEVELLRPIDQGAGIVYVVDGSLPYSPEYETEMEILRWTAKPRLALINPIGGDAFVEQWQQALSQYFSLVRVFNPLEAGFEQHLQLLHAFGQLHLGSPGSLEHAISELQTYRKMQLRQAARLIVERLYRLSSYHVDTSGGYLPEALRKDPVEQFNLELNRIEQESRRELEVLFLHHGMQTEMASMNLLPGELMDREQWSLWGLQRSQLAVASAAAGASIGFGADLAAGGHSLFLGSVGGGVLGGLTGWLGSDWLRQRLPAWLPYHRKQQQLGPVSDPNFAFVILGRSLQHAQAMLRHSHADRAKLRLDTGQGHLMSQLPTGEQVRLLKLAWQLRRQGLEGAAAGKLEDWVLDQLGG